MVKLIRRFQQPLMLIITVLVIISFAWLYNTNSFMDKGGADKVGTIYGHPVTFAQAQKIGRKFELSQDLGLRELYESLAVRRQDAKENFIWNSYVLQHEAAQLGIEPTADEIVAAIQAMPVFQTNGAYDSAKYNLIVQVALAPRGFTGADMEDLVRDDLRLKRIKALLGATVAPADSEVRAAYAQLNERIEASVVRLKLADFLAAAQVPDEDVKKLFEERKVSLTTDELRKVKFAAFILPTTDKPLEGKERADALGKLAKQAEDFAVDMTAKDAKLDDVAAKYRVKIEETPDFSAAQPPPELGSSPEVAGAAFKLTQKDPNSDILSTDRGYYVLQLAAITPPRPLTFDEAKERLLADLKNERAREALGLKGAEIRTKIEAEIKAGKSFADAAAAAGAKAEKFPAFSRREPQFEPANSGEIMQTAIELNAGQLSGFVPAADGGVIVHVDQRPPVDEEKFKAEKARFVEGVSDFQKNALFQQWLKLRRDAAAVQTTYRG
jgi:peptidyl-prolyl cis-trans isomerase D